MKENLSENVRFSVDDTGFMLYDLMFWILIIGMVLSVLWYWF